MRYYPNEPNKLTLGEMRVYEQAITHKSGKEICSALNICRSTLYSHLNNIYRKLGCSGRLELIYRFKEG
jgi:DNA-binding CsgD family transcriptional regulator